MKNPTRFIIAAAAWALLAATAGAATPFTKPMKKKHAASSMPEAKDTLFCPPHDSIAVSGYEKTLRSARENMYVTNRTGRPVDGIELEITYYDMQGRMLHKSVHKADLDLPPGETRMAEVPSFDRQGVYYYYLSPVPQRARHATPFKTGVSVRYITFPKQK